MTEIKYKITNNAAGWFSVEIPTEKTEDWTVAFASKDIENCRFWIKRAVEPPFVEYYDADGNLIPIK